MGGESWPRPRPLGAVCCVGECPGLDASLPRSDALLCPGDGILSPPVEATVLVFNVTGVAGATGNPKPVRPGFLTYNVINKLVK